MYYAQISTAPNDASHGTSGGREMSVIATYLDGLREAAFIADRRKDICFEAAREYTDPVMARSEQCAGLEAQHIADEIRRLIGEQP